MDPLTRFSPLVRKGLRFRRRFEDAKKLAAARGFEWYPYDCFSNLFLLQRLCRSAGCDFDSLVGDAPVLDLGAADGALSFYLESLGFQVHAVDHAGSNMNGMQGIRALHQQLGSNIEIMDVDIDSQFRLSEQYGLALFLGTLYHLKNPFYALETVAHHARFGFVSTRVARRSPDGTGRLDQMPVAYLLGDSQCNADSTNYWIFSPPGLTLLLERAGWTIRSVANTGNPDSDPASPDHDERMFALVASRHLVSE
ncbi:MAG: methyltransferase domain-containing protein [Bryobacteraceae bacterium]